MQSNIRRFEVYFHKGFKKRRQENKFKVKTKTFVSLGKTIGNQFCMHERVLEDVQTTYLILQIFSIYHTSMLTSRMLKQNYSCNFTRLFAFEEEDKILVKSSPFQMPLASIVGHQIQLTL